MNGTMAPSLANQEKQPQPDAHTDAGLQSRDQRRSFEDHDSGRRPWFHSRRIHIVMLVLAIGWTAMVLVGTALPAVMVPKTTLRIWDKAIHFGLFAGFGFLWLSALPGKAVWSIAVIGSGAALGLITELYQHYWIPGRSGDPKDFLADCIGVLAAWILYALGRLALRHMTSRPARIRADDRRRR